METTTTNIASVVNSSFLSRVPEILERGGFTLQMAIEQAYREDEKFCLEMHDGTSERAMLARKVVSGRAYDRIRAANPNPAPSFQPRYVAYASANGNTPEEQLAIDKANGSFVDYLVWSAKRDA